MKRKKRLRLPISLLLTAVLLTLSVPGSAADGIPETIRIGLAYGSDALPGANLLNEVGSGYQLGYFDDALSFVPLWTTGETAISVVKTQNVWYGPLSGTNRSGYSDAFTSGVAVGCYHIGLPETYATLEEAELAAMGWQGAFPAWIQGVCTVRVGAYLTLEEAQSALEVLGIEGAGIVGTSAYGVSVVKTGTGSILFQFDGGVELPLGVVPMATGAEPTQTWFAGRRYFGAFRYERIGGGNLTVVNILDREAYINCVISQEMGDSWPIEALKAQAVAARSYAATCSGGDHARYHFDLCATTHCQAYPGCAQIGAGTTQAAEETRGEYVRYQGEICQAYYFSSDGGATEDVRNVWSGNSVLPYLKGVADPWESGAESRIPNYRWSYTFTKERLAEKLRASGRNCAELVDVRPTYTEMGNIKSLIFTDKNGKSWTITGDRCRTLLGVKSVRFAVEGGGGSYFVDEGVPLETVTGAYAIDGSGNVSKVGGAPYVLTGSGLETLQPPPQQSDSFIVSGSGSGHNVGMSQWGAYAMAKQGKTYRDILTFYYTGVEIY